MAKIDHNSTHMRTLPTARALGARGVAHSEHIEITGLVGPRGICQLRIWIGGGDVHWIDLDAVMCRELAKRLTRKAEEIEASGNPAENAA